VSWLHDALQDWKHGAETSSLDAIATGSTIETEDGRQIPLRAQVNARYGRLLYYLVKHLKPTTIVEIGMANGISSAYLASAHLRYVHDEKAVHWIMDPFQSTQWQGAGRHLLRRLELDFRVHLLEEPSIHALPKLESQGVKADFVFIDGNHCMDYVLADVLLSDRILNIGGVIALDDAQAYGVKRAIPYLDRYRRNLARLPMDPPWLHRLREWTGKRRRIALYQKVAEDDRGADAC